MSLLSFLRRKKKQPKQDGTVLGGGYSADADKVLRQIKSEPKKTEEAPKARPADPNLPAEQYSDIAKSLTDAEKERKRKLARMAMSKK